MNKTDLENLKVRDILKFGSYPQDIVIDDTIVNALKKICGEPKIACDSIWKSYEYAYGSGMYADVDYSDKLYRVVYRQKHREDNISYEYSDYSDDKIYVFIFEPILWRVLNIVNGKALLISQKLLDTQEFFVGKKRRVNKTTIYINNYEYSSIRMWLNNDFYDTAFNEVEKSVIALTGVCNGACTTKNENNAFACNDTFDNVFLLSFQEAKTFFVDNKDRWKKATEYAKSQGCSVYKTRDKKYNNAIWWLRSPDHKYENCVRCVGDGGGLGDGGFSCSNEPADSCEAVAPVMYINIE